LFFAGFTLMVIGLLADLIVRLNRPAEQVEPSW